MVITYLIVVLMVIFSSSMVLSDSSEKNEACDSLLNDALNGKICCNNEIFSKDRLDISKCKVFEDKDMMCDHNKCVLELENVLTNDEIDDDKVKKLLDQWEKDYPKEKSMTIRAKKACLDGKYLEYMNKHSCIESKLYFCVYVNAMADCQSWEEDAECAKVKEHAQKCKDAQDMQ